MKREQSLTDNITIVTWNINGVGNKLENSLCKNLILDKDIICLNEIKTAHTFSVPGFHTYTSRGENRHRGGCAVLMKNRLHAELCHMDIMEDLILFRFRSIPITFISCYIPPKDSPYFSLEAVARLNSLLRENPTENYMLVGDLNCKYAGLRESFVKDSNVYQYRLPEDNMIRPNDNAQILLDVLCPSMTLINGLCNSDTSVGFTNALTFRQRNRWVSELDHVYISDRIVNAVTALDINSDLRLPSNHAPVSTTLDISKVDCRLAMLQNLESRSVSLGNYSSLKYNPSCLSSPQIRWNKICKREVADYLTRTEPPIIDERFEVNDMVAKVNFALRECLVQNEIRVETQLSRPHDELQPRP